MSIGEFLRTIARKKPTPPTTLIVSGESITVNDIVDMPIPAELFGQSHALGTWLKPIAKEAPNFDTFSVNTRTAVHLTVSRRISNILLYQKAKHELGEAKKVDEMLEKEMQRVWREFVVQNGGNDAEAMKVLKEQKLSKDQFLEEQKMERLSFIHIQSKTKQDSPISHLELLAAYEEMRETDLKIDPQITIRLIDIQPMKIILTDPTNDRLAEAREQAEGLLARIENGEDFADLAKEYSHGFRAHDGGLWSPRRPDSFAQPWDVLAKTAVDMEIGDIRGPIVLGDTNLALAHVILLRLEDKEEGGYKTLEEAQAEVEMKIRNDRYLKALEELNKEIAELSQVGNIEQFIQYSLEVLYQRYRS